MRLTAPLQAQLPTPRDLPPQRRGNNDRSSNPRPVVHLITDRETPMPDGPRHPAKRRHNRRPRAILHHTQHADQKTHLANGPAHRRRRRRRASSAPTATTPTARTAVAGAHKTSRSLRVNDASQNRYRQRTVARKLSLTSTRQGTTSSSRLTVIPVATTAQGIQHLTQRVRRRLRPHTSPVGLIGLGTSLHCL